MTDEKKIITPEQRRAMQAWKETESLTGRNAEDFANQCKQTSARIINSGLLPALAFLYAHEKAADGDADQSRPADQMKKCADALTSRLVQFVKEKSSAVSAKIVFEKLIKEADSVILRRAQTEALAYLEWLARLAEGRSFERDSEKGEAS